MKLVSPKKGQDFIWLAEYLNGSYLTEFDLNSCEDNSFYTINKYALVRFGLIGHNIKMFYEVLGGFFNIAGTFIELLLKDKEGREYPLTGKQDVYNDIITFKDAEASFDMLGTGGVRGHITKYNFGYKKYLSYDDLNVGARIIFTIPYKQLSYFNFRFVVDRVFEGELLIKYSSKVVEALSCRFEKDKAYELNWIMK